MPAPQVIPWVCARWRKPRLRAAGRCARRCADAQGLPAASSPRSGHGGLPEEAALPWKVPSGNGWKTLRFHFKPVPSTPGLGEDLGAVPAAADAPALSSLRPVVDTLLCTVAVGFSSRTLRWVRVRVRTPAGVAWGVRWRWVWASPSPAAPAPSPPLSSAVSRLSRGEFSLFLFGHRHY